MEGGASQRNVGRQPLTPSNFVRSSPGRLKTLDLVDVVAGGDGFSGQRNKGIDPISGESSMRWTRWRSPLAWRRTVSSRGGNAVRRRRVRSRRREGPVQVDSAGHVFDGFPTTTNTTWQYIWAGGSLAVDRVSTTLGAIDYASPDHGLLYFNGNAAITFDLDAIRRANAGCKLLRFRAMAANPGDDVNFYADIWVLVDGEKRFQRRRSTVAVAVFRFSCPSTTRIAS